MGSLIELGDEQGARVPQDVIILHGGALPSRIIRFRGAGAGKGTEASPHIKQYRPVWFTVAIILYLYAGSEDGSKTKDPHGKREAQQKHHSEGERGEDPGKTVICRLDACKRMEIVAFLCGFRFYVHDLRHPSRPSSVFNDADLF